MFFSTDTEQTQTFTDTSSTSQQTISLSTEPLASTLVVATTEASSSSSDWRDFIITDHVANASGAATSEARSARLPQQSPGTTHEMGNSTAFSAQTAALTDSTFTSSTISRAGERTLLSVTSSSSNSTSSAFTEDSNSHQPSSTWDIHARATGPEDYTHSAPSTRTDSRDTTDQHMTHSFKGVSSETGSPEGSRGTQSLTGSPNATQHQHTSMSVEPSNSTPLLRMTEPTTDQSEVSVYSTPSVTSSAGGPTNISGTDQESGSNVGTSTAFSTSGHGASTQNQESTEGVSSQTREENVGFGLTTVSPTDSSSVSDMDTPSVVSQLLSTTTPVIPTERYMLRFH